ncbi:unnamed protein product [Effrenium voratum]|nr:unnamed protein product [Effrenium voratum]|eukprot:CAMPEP_0181431630 /NCGR_PEP_ID=MMETSP1110-20121109/18348_1 /TAXON_ID=174948 /ORGANISM="Symbiodinium sp., Strain CCMP421" /LENGTH=548 /DNA_ID=CAMNT_0023555003 /DNA_START=42 /DNA_END=1688 /DNA_ORIENTATION=+
MSMVKADEVHSTSAGLRNGASGAEDGLQGASAGVRSHLFNSFLTIAMMTTFLAYFLITPWLSTIAQNTSVSLQIVTLVAAVYEGGKLVGCVLFGHLGDSGNILRVMLVAMLVLTLLSVIMTIFLATALPSGPWAFVVFSIIYFLISMASVAPQFGLSILKKTNSAHRCRIYVLIQGIVACLAQGASVPFGDFLGSLISWKMVLLVLGLFVAFMSSVLYLTATHAHLDACNAKPSGSQQSNYWKTAGGLLFSRQYRSFQIFIVVLGISTANMYLIPTYGMMLPEWEAGIDTQTATYFVAASFLANLGTRCLALLLASRVSGALCVRLGAAILVLGSLVAMILGWAELLPVSGRFLTTALILQAGVGLAMPNCKACALLGVPNEVSSTANSLLKIAQLLFTVVAQLLATVSHCESSFKNLSLLLLIWNCLSLPIMFTKGQSSSGDRKVEVKESDLVLSVRSCKELGTDARDRFLQIYTKHGFCILECEDSDFEALDSVGVAHAACAEQDCTVVLGSRSVQLETSQVLLMDQAHKVAPHSGLRMIMTREQV